MATYSSLALQERGHIVVPMTQSVGQRGLPPSIGDVDLGSLGHQVLHQLEVALGSGDVKSSPAVVILRVANSTRDEPTRGSDCQLPFLSYVESVPKCSGRGPC